MLLKNSIHKWGLRSFKGHRWKIWLTLCQGNREKSWSIGLFKEHCVSTHTREKGLSQFCVHHFFNLTESDWCSQLAT
jgi:hypothetical protein